MAFESEMQTEALLDSKIGTQIVESKPQTARIH